MIHTHATKYAALAVALGYSIAFVQRNGVNTPEPKTFILGNVEVFQTERGWRVASIGPDGKWPESRSEDYFLTLDKALIAGASRATLPATAENPLLEPLREITRMVQSSSVPPINPYAIATVKRALVAIKDVTGFAGDWMDANQEVKK